MAQSIEVVANKAMLDTVLSRGDLSYQAGFMAGAEYQHNADMKKLKSVLNSLMVDTRDKATILSLMEEQ
ncbi:MAG: hypothetical protein Q4A15_12995 [Prevotellaceae bacterium]|nr:hypothetical protein [Prevotellaceae bacterium]